MKNTCSVFLIDTNETDNFIHQRVLQNCSESINVSTFSNSAEALKYLEKNKIVPQYILLGLNVPAGNGFDFLEQYEKLNFDKKDTSVYVLSTLLLPGDLEKLKRDYSYINYIEKPLTIKKLSSIFDNIDPEIKNEDCFENITGSNDIKGMREVV